MWPQCPSQKMCVLVWTRDKGISRRPVPRGRWGMVSATHRRNGTIGAGKTLLASPSIIGALNVPAGSTKRMAMSCCGPSARGGSSRDALAFPHPRSSRALAAATRAFSFRPFSQILTSVESAAGVCRRANSRISPWPFGRPPGLPLRPFSNRNLGSCYRPVLRAFYLMCLQVWDKIRCDSTIE